MLKKIYGVILKLILNLKVEENLKDVETVVVNHRVENVKTVNYQIDKAHVKIRFIRAQKKGNPKVAFFIRKKQTYRS
jgi:hypothetical protein